MRNSRQPHQAPATFDIGLNWENLRKNRCPKCSKDFVVCMVSVRQGYITCRCGFEIAEVKYNEIVQERVARELDRKPPPPDPMMAELGMQIATTSFLDD